MDEATQKSRVKRNGLLFYRCYVCRRVVSHWDIEKHHGCSHCQCNKIVATNLTWWEKLVQLFKHPKIWEWPDSEKLVEGDPES